MGIPNDMITITFKDTKGRSSGVEKEWSGRKLRKNMQRSSRIKEDSIEVANSLFLFAKARLKEAIKKKHFLFG